VMPTSPRNCVMNFSAVACTAALLDIFYKDQKNKKPAMHTTRT
jgi:hypothetical protein